MAGHQSVPAGTLVPNPLDPAVICRIWRPEPGQNGPRTSADHREVGLPRARWHSERRGEHRRPRATRAPGPPGMGPARRAVADLGLDLPRHRRRGRVDAAPHRPTASASLAAALLLGDDPRHHERASGRCGSRCPSCGPPRSWASPCSAWASAPSPWPSATCPAASPPLLVAVMPLWIILFRLRGGRAPRRADADRRRRRHGRPGPHAAARRHRAGGRRRRRRRPVVDGHHAVDASAGPSSPGGRRATPSRATPLVTTTYEMAFAGAALVGVGALRGERLHVEQFAAGSWWALGLPRAGVHRRVHRLHLAARPRADVADRHLRVRQPRRRGPARLRSSSASRSRATCCSA